MFDFTSKYREIKVELSKDVCLVGLGNARWLIFSVLQKVDDGEDVVK